MALEAECPFLPPGHYVAKDSSVQGVALKLAYHCAQNHRNEPMENWPDEVMDEPDLSEPNV